MLSRIAQNSRRTLSSTKVFNHSVVNKAFEVEISDHHFNINDLKISFSWLRDHCRSQTHYDLRNHQRRVEYPKETKVESFKIQDENLIINWKDQHSSKYSLVNLEEAFGIPDTKSEFAFTSGILAEAWPPKFWDANNCPVEESKIDFETYMNCSEGFKKAMSDIWTHGFCIITNAPMSIENGTKPIADRIGPISNNQYTKHGYWELNNKGQADHTSDASYTNIALNPHTDGTYYMTAPGLQLFHCQQNSTCGGGKTLLVDGFNLASQFKDLSPEGYQFLSNYPLEAEYVHVSSEPQSHYVNKDVAFKHCPHSGHLIQIRLKSDNRATHANMKLEDQIKFYDYYPKLVDMSKDEKLVKTFHLNAGDVLVANNWRLLHGRTSFTGERILSGCWIAMDVFASRSQAILI